MITIRIPAISPINPIMSTLNPVKIFEALYANSRPQKQRSLAIIQEVCLELHKLGSLDFTLATVGRLSEKRGGLAQRTLYNAQSNDFKTLIRAWASFSCIPKATKNDHKHRDNHGDDFGLISKINDPAMRVLLGQIVAERNQLKSENKLLKSQANVVIDRRVLPGHINITPEGKVIQILENADLSGMEKASLELAISANFFKQEGWTEGANGEIINSSGRKIFEIGFANAIRKILSV